MRIKAVLFDLDGVLIDTESIYTDFWQEVDRRHPTNVDNFAMVIKGSTLNEIFHKYFPDKNVQEEVAGELKVFEENMPYRFFDGTENLLVRLRENGLSIAVVTSSNRTKMMRVFKSLPALQSGIDTLVTDEDVTESKPHPQGYLLAAKRLGVEPSLCAVVEDSLAGLTAGRRAGAYVVGIATTNPRSAILPLADTVLDSVAELAELIEF